MRWTHETCQEEALKYNNKMDFKNNGKGSYCYALRNNIIKECCAHMNGPIMWTHDLVKQEALKYSTRTEFILSKGCAYGYAVKHGLYEECCAHMDIVGSKYKRCIYVCIFPDNSCYIGLTHDIKERMKGRDNDNRETTTQYKIVSGLSYETYQLTDYIEVTESQKLEGYYVDVYKDLGWNVLNRIKTGGLGGGIRIWNHETMKIEALKYKTKKEWMESGYGITYARKHGIYEECCAHMRGLTRWNHENVKIEALKYIRRIDFEKNSNGAFAYSKRHGIYEECCAHMIERFRWNHETVKIEASKYDTRNTFKNGCGNAYRYALKNKLMDELFPK